MLYHLLFIKLHFTLLLLSLLLLLLSLFNANLHLVIEFAFIPPHHCWATKGDERVFGDVLGTHNPQTSEDSAHHNSIHGHHSRCLCLCFIDRPKIEQHHHLLQRNF